MSSEYQDPAKGADQLDVESWSANVGRVREWYKPWTWRNSERVIEKRSHNRFQDDEVPGVAKRRQEKKALGPTREVQKGDKCWTEAQYEVVDYITRHFIKKRWIEWWSVNKTLEAYYNFMTGAKVDIPAGALGVAGGIAAAHQTMTGAAAAGAAVAAQATAAAATTTAATGAAVTATTAATAAAAEAAAASTAATTAGGAVAAPVVIAAATFVTAFVTTTQVMANVVESAEMISEGWEFVGKYDGEEELLQQSVIWERVGSVRDCPAPTSGKQIYGLGAWLLPLWLFFLRWWLWSLVALLAISAAVALLFLAPRGESVTGVAPAPSASAAASLTTPSPTTLTSPAAPRRPPVVTLLESKLAVPVTTYIVTASDPDRPNDPNALTYQWSMVGETCGTPVTPWKQTGASVRWSHNSGPPDNCQHLGTDHEVTTTVIVASGSGSSVQCVIQGSGDRRIQNPPCQALP